MLLDAGTPRMAERRKTAKCIYSSQTIFYSLTAPAYSIIQILLCTLHFILTVLIYHPPPLYSTFYILTLLIYPPLPHVTFYIPTVLIYIHPYLPTFELVNEGHLWQELTCGEPRKNVDVANVLPLRGA